jgi:hypothetical protein
MPTTTVHISPLYICAACSALKHVPASLLELTYEWELYDVPAHSLDLSHLTALTKLTTSKTSAGQHLTKRILTLIHGSSLGFNG